MTTKELQTKCYQRYQMQWMTDHGITIEDLGKMTAEWATLTMAGENDLEFQEYLEEIGFEGGSLWVCMDEFLGAEFMDTQYMTNLLAGDPILLDGYIAARNSKEEEE